MSKRRSTKFWFKREKEIMQKLGCKPQPGSGSGYIHKEDGENDNVLVQLKSTDAQAITIHRLDINKLMFHADSINKVPVFVIDFVDGPLLIATVPDELENLSKYLSDELFEKNTDKFVSFVQSEEVVQSKKTIKRSTTSAQDIIDNVRKDNWRKKEVKEEKSFLERAFERK